jgi:hypothetical protein
MTSSILPVIAGLAIGLAFVVLLSMNLRLDNTLSDEELIAKYSKLPETRYFLEKHPDAKADVDRISHENALMVSFSVEKQVAPASDFYSGINIFSVTAYNNRLTQLNLSVECGSNGMTVGVGLADVSGIDAAEEWCFQTLDRNGGILEPDKSSNELNDTVYQFAFMP